MKNTNLNAISPLDGRYAERLGELAPYTSESALIKTRIEVEIKYLIALSEAKVIRDLTPEEKKILEDLTTNMKEEDVLQVKEIEGETRHDVKAVERFLREKLASTSLKDLLEFIHFGLTSEDVNNLAYRLMLSRGVSQVILQHLNKVLKDLSDKSAEYKSLPMLARTHGQAAVPTTLGKEIVNFVVRLRKQMDKLKAFKLTGKITGAVGNYNAHNVAFPKTDWVEFSKNFVESLGLTPNIYTTQINPADDVVEILQIIQRINMILTDLAQDFWRYISDDWFTQELKSGEVGSSTMPQKVNPIDFENAEGNLFMANTLIEGFTRKLPISRLQRDLSDSTVTRNLGVILGHSLLAYKSLITGLSRVHANEAVIKAVLNNNWAILAEAAQTVLRREGVADAYNLVKDLSRGQKIGQSEWREWVSKLPVSDEVKKELESLTPEKYTGLAADLTEKALKAIK